MANSSNPLTTVKFAVPFDRITAEHVEPAVDELIAAGQAAIDAIAADSAPRTYDSTLGALERATEALEWAMTVVGHLESVATTPALRTAYNAVQPRVSAFWSKIPMHARLWQALRDFAGTDEAGALTGAHKRHLDKTLDEFRRHGAELDDAGKEKLAAIDVELSTLTTTFSQHTLDATNAFELVITDEARLAGLPESARAAAHESAVQKGVEGWRFTLQAPSVIPVLTYMDDASTREAVWRAYNDRAHGGDLDNEAIIARVLELRGAKAKLLGYADWADFVLADRMAGSAARAREFVDELRDKTRSAVDRENRELIEFRRNAGDDGEMKAWDVAYWSEKQRKALYAFDAEELRPYFPADAVLRGVFDTVNRLYGIRVEKDDDAPTWDPEVTAYRMVDADGSHMASFYVDLYPRENKRGGAWMNGLITGVRPSPHLGLFCANVNRPVGDTPALLTHREVETIFHEFGHLVHHCVGDSPVRSRGSMSVAWDFVELPSQIMENWCWEREALDLFARHWKTGETIPDELLDKMQRARTYRAGNAQMRQLGFAAVDLALHCDYDPARDGDVVAYARGVLQAHAPTPLPERYAMICSFGHLFSSPVGYAAGYYSYKWAEVLDADAFTRFRDEGVFNSEVGQAFRREVLAPGDTRDPMELYRAFMGREPALEALLVRLGLAN